MYHNKKTIIGVNTVPGKAISVHFFLFGEIMSCHGCWQKQNCKDQTQRLLLIKMQLYSLCMLLAVSQQKKFV